EGLGTAQNGTIYGFRCAPGLGGPFCRECRVGTYKAVYGSVECQACTGAPQHSSYTASGWRSSECPYTCNEVLNAFGDYCVALLLSPFLLFTPAPFYSRSESLKL